MLYLVVGVPGDYTLPKINDPDNDRYEVLVNLGSAVSFAKYYQGNRSFSFLPK